MTVKLARFLKFLLPVYLFVLLFMTGCEDIIQGMIDNIMRELFARLNPFYFLTAAGGGGPPVAPEQAAATGATGAAVVGILAILLNHLSTATSAVDSSVLSSGADIVESEPLQESDQITDNPPEEARSEVAPGYPENERSPEQTRTAVSSSDGSQLLFDPISQRSLVVDENGNVVYQGEMMSVAQAQENILINQEYLTAREAGQTMVDGFKETLANLESADATVKEQMDKFRDLREQLDAATDPAEIKEIQDKFLAQNREFKDVLKDLRNSDDPRIVELESRLRAQADQMNANYASKNILKGEGRTGSGAAFDVAVHETYEVVDGGTIESLNEMGFHRGGAEFTGEDFKEFRNSLSAGTVGTDRDWGLNEERMRELQSKLDAAEPGSEEAQTIARDLMAEREKIRITVDPEKQAAYFRREIVATNDKLDDLRDQLQTSAPDSPEAASLQSQIDRLSNRPDELKNELADLEARAAQIKQSYITELQQKLAGVAPGSAEAQRITKEIGDAELRLAGRAELDVSPGSWNETAQRAYNRTFSDTTNTDARQAFQSLTNSKNVEAYPDARVLAGQSADPRWAAQTAAVPQVKEIDNKFMVQEGVIKQGESIQETARGYSKDITSKVISQLQQDPNVTSDRLKIVTEINRTFKEVGDGTILPGDADAVLQHRIPEIKDLTVEKATRIIDANYESSIKYQGTGAGAAGAGESASAGTSSVKGALPSGGAAAEAGPDQPVAHAEEGLVNKTWGRVNELAAAEGYYRENVAQGMSGGEAVGVAAAQTLAGNAVLESGVVSNPGIAMAGGALLPGGARNFLPDQAIANWIGTSDQAGGAIIGSVKDSIASGQLDTRALDKFVDNLNQRPGADPFKGINQATELGFEEVYRNDGGNIIKDLQNINDTGAGIDVASESLEEFQKGIAAGQPGDRIVVLQGWDHLARSASEIAVDPANETKSLVNDISNMYNYGVGDNYWSETWESTKSVIQDTPVVDKVIEGYNNIAEGIGESGAAGFTQEMYEGGKALAGEATGAVGDGVVNTYNYIKSIF